MILTPGHSDGDDPCNHHRPRAAQAKPRTDRNGDGRRKSRLLRRTNRNCGACAFGISISAWREFAARPLNQKLEETWAGQGRAQQTGALDEPGKYVVPRENTIYQIRLYDRQKNVMHIASIFFLDSSFRMVQRVDARRITWTNPGWLAEDGLIVGFRRQNTEQQWFDRKEARFERYSEGFHSRPNGSRTTSAGKTCTVTWKKLREKDSAQPLTGLT